LAAIHVPVKPACSQFGRGMGGNQALHDTADALSAVEALKLSTRKDLPSNKELQAAVTQYESKMMPRAFRWVKTSGGLGGSDVKTHTPPTNARTTEDRDILTISDSSLQILRLGKER
jgi:hypothetical protein